MSLIQDRAVYITADGINKTLKQAIIDGDLSGGGGGGGGGGPSFSDFRFREEPEGLYLESRLFDAWIVRDFYEKQSSNIYYYRDYSQPDNFLSFETYTPISGPSTSGVTITGGTLDFQIKFFEFINYIFDLEVANPALLADQTDKTLKATVTYAPFDPAVQFTLEFGSLGGFSTDINTSTLNPLGGIFTATFSSLRGSVPSTTGRPFSIFAAAGTNASILSFKIKTILIEVV